MSTDTFSTPEIHTLADHVARLGGVPLDRIRYRPFPGTATEKDLFAAADRDGYFCELVDGTLVEKPASYRESLLAVALAAILRTFVKARKLGIITGEQGMMRLARSLVRGPDVAFVSANRLPGRRVPRDRVPTIAPDLAVEILSKSNTRAEMKRKRGEYFRAGTKLVWEIDAQKRTIRVYRNPRDFTELSETDMLDGGSVLPGFSLSLREFFAELDEEWDVPESGPSK